MQRAIVFIAFLLMLIFPASLGNLETYHIRIIKPGGYLSEEDLLNYYLSILPSSAEFIRPITHGFTARLTFEEVTAMRYIEGFYSAISDNGCYTTFSLNPWEENTFSEESACRRIKIKAPGNTFSKESIEKGVPNNFWGW